MNTVLGIYLKARRLMYFLGNPLCYLTCLPFLALYFLSEPGGFIEEALLASWNFLKDISSFIFFAGTGPETPGMHLTMTLTLPTSIALIWVGIEKISGLQRLLKRKGVIPE